MVYDRVANGFINHFLLELESLTPELGLEEDCLVPKGWSIHLNLLYFGVGFQPPELFFRYLEGLLQGPLFEHSSSRTVKTIKLRF